MSQSVRLLQGVSLSPSGGDSPVLEAAPSRLPTSIPNHFSREECREIIRISQVLPEVRCQVGDGGYHYGTEGRVTWQRTLFPTGDFQWIFDRLEDASRIVSERYGIDVVGILEGVQLYRYPVGGYLSWHMDIGKGIMSHRKFSLSVQLSDSDDYEGGDVEFADMDVIGSREIGTVNSFPCYHSHRVSHITRGERSCLVAFVQGFPFR